MRINPTLARGLFIGLRRLLSKIQPMRSKDNLILIEGLPTPEHPLQAQLDQLTAEIEHIRAQQAIVAQRSIYNV